jgi:aminoglycoside phosphotransferase family enzyme/predicted kinase
MARHFQSDSHAELVSAMMNPAFYPKPPSQVRHKETHISHVFLAGELVYKIKKAVRLSFLDYSTLDRRRHFLQEELRLNRRLAPSVYLAIAPITFENSVYTLNGEGSPAEYALVMRRLPESRMLSSLIESGELDVEMMRSLADVLGRFHAGAERIEETLPARYPDIVATQWNENIKDLRPFAVSTPDRETLETLENFGRRFIERHRDLLRRRPVEGRIRDVHGDLHCEHVCFAPEGIQIYDCIEFSPKLRRCDLASEIAFLLMDLQVRGGGAFAPDFLARYLETVDDPELPRLLPFYKCYRALVRAKVEAMRGSPQDLRGSRYLCHAARFTWDAFKPFLVIVCGLTGSGKSTLARVLENRIGLPVINSDVVRKKLAGDSGRHVVAFEQGIYSQRMTDRTYAEMARLAENEITAGNGAILDATFGRRADRERILRLAEKHSVPFAVIHCVASDETTRGRLAERAKEGKDVSDGRWEIYEQQKETYEPIEDIPAASRLDLDTDAELEHLAQASERFLRSRLEGGAG